MTRMRPGQLVEERRVGLRRVLREAGRAVDAHGEDLAAGLERAADEAEVDAGPDVGDVERTRRGSTSGVVQPAAVQLVAQLEQVVLPDAFVVDELHGEAGARARP